MLTLRWPRHVAIVICGVVGFVLPALFGNIVGIPDPVFHDEFSYLLGADTFAHGRLTNPPQSFPQFFEAPHVIVTPTYQSKYPPGQALILALGQVVGGHPIWGVWLSCGFFAATLCWMLQAWTSKQLALAITLLAVATWGTSSYWAQSYWGGMVAASGGALFFGGFRRAMRSPSAGIGLLIGVGILILANTRPYEGLLAIVPAALLLGRRILSKKRHQTKHALSSFILTLATMLGLGGAFVARYNAAVTGAYTRTPYSMHLRQYFGGGVFLFSSPHSPERDPVERLARFYQGSTPAPVAGASLLGEFAENLAVRLPMAVTPSFALAVVSTAGRQHYRGAILWLTILLPFCVRGPSRTILGITLLAVTTESIIWWYVPMYPWPLAPLILTAWIVACDRTRSRNRWGTFIGATIFFVALGQSIVRWWYPHYAAPVACLVLAAAATSVQRLSRHSNSLSGRRLGITLGVLITTHFCALSLLSRPVVPGTAAGAHIEFRTQGDVRRHLVRQGGKHLVFIKYTDDFSTDAEWVYNGADPSAETVIFAHDLQGERKDGLIGAYSHRAVWSLSVSPQRVHLEKYWYQQRFGGTPLER